MHPPQHLHMHIICPYQEYCFVWATPSRLPCSFPTRYYYFIIWIWWDLHASIQQKRCHPSPMQCQLLCKVDYLVYFVIVALSDITGCVTPLSYSSADVFKMYLYLWSCRVVEGSFEAPGAGVFDFHESTWRWCHVMLRACIDKTIKREVRWAAYHPNIMSITWHLHLMKAATGKTHAARPISVLVVDIVVGKGDSTRSHCGRWSLRP